MAAGLPKMQRWVVTVLFARRGRREGCAVSDRLSRRRGWLSLLCSVTCLSLGSLALPSQLDSASELGTPPPLPVEISQQRSPSPDLGTLRTSPLTDRSSHQTSVICLGDSLTQGVGATPGHDYPSLLSQALGTSVSNAGVDGDETADALKRLDTDVLAKDPRLVVVELGANDFLDGVPLKQAFANLDAIVQRIEVHGAMVVLVGMAPGPLGDALQNEYDRIIQQYHVAFVPKVLDGIITDPNLQSSDRLHPNDQGYALITERIRRVVEPLLTHRKPS